MMSFVGLPGEASTVLVLGLFVNIYAALGAIISLSLTAKQITIIAIFLSFAHTLPVEVEITKKVGAPRKLILTVRLVSGILGAFITNLIL
jgi:putative effector of murein hydrolase